jgi:hypothetical protein
MAPLLVKLLAILPAIVSAKDALKKDNLFAPSTYVAAVAAIGAVVGPDVAGLAPDSLESVVVQAVLAAIALVSFLLKAKTPK